METSISIFWIIAAYVIGWFWGEEVRGYFRRRRMSKGLKERLEKL